MSFAHPQWLWIVPVVLTVIAIGAMGYVRRRRQLVEVFGGEEVARRLTGVDLYRIPYGRLALFFAAGALVALAMAEPRTRNAGVLAPGEPWEIILAVDISRSMQATDVAPTRLAAARDLLPSLLEPLRNQRVGLMLFAGESYVISPPTLDHDVLRFFIEGIDPELVSETDEGTLLAAPLTRAQQIFESQPRGAGGRAIVLVTDGDLQEAESTVLEGVRDLAGLGVRIFTVGVGTAEGSGLVLPHRPGRWGGPLLDESGSPVITRLDESLLERIAEVGNGRYAAASSAASMSAQMRALAALPNSSARGSGGWLRGHNAVFWFTAVALLLLVLESLAHNRWRVPRLYRPVYRPLAGTLRRI